MFPGLIARNHVRHRRLHLVLIVLVIHEVAALEELQRAADVVVRQSSGAGGRCSSGAVKILKPPRGDSLRAATRQVPVLDARWRQPTLQCSHQDHPFWSWSTIECSSFSADPNESPIEPATTIVASSKRLLAMRRPLQNPVVMPSDAGDDA